MTSDPALRLTDYERALSSSLGSQWSVQCYQSLGSTMEPARNAAAGEEPLLVLARTQEKGRGRQGRSWQGYDGDLLATYLLPFPFALERCAGLSLAVGVLLREVLAEFGAETLLKWPNDLVVADTKFKIAGVLIELDAENRRILVGIGVNIPAADRESRRYGALEAVAKKRVSALDLAASLANPLLELSRQIAQSGFGAYRARWLEGVWRPQRIEIDTGAEVVSGDLSGVDDKGALLVRSGGSTIAVVAGHVLRWS